MTDIVFATKNEGKMKEIRQVLGGFYNVISMREAEIDADIVEDGKTFEENSIKKAEEIAKICGKIVLADDSGLEIDFLDKAPGVYSSRYMGEDTPYEVKNGRILTLLKDVPDKKRTARFVCAVAAAAPDRKTIVVREEIEGVIGYEIKGENGFGYDPIFFLPQYGMTTAQLPPEKKNEISHRGKALRAMKRKLEEEWGL